MCGIWTPHQNWRIFEADAEDICWSCESSLVVDFGPEIAAADGTVRNEWHCVECCAKWRSWPKS